MMPLMTRDAEIFPWERRLLEDEGVTDDTVTSDDVTTDMDPEMEPGGWAPFTINS